MQRHHDLIKATCCEIDNVTTFIRQCATMQLIREVTDKIPYCTILRYYKMHFGQLIGSFFRYTHGHLWTHNYWRNLWNCFKFLMWVTINLTILAIHNCLRLKKVHLSFFLSCCYGSMGWWRLQVVHILIIADNCIAFLQGPRKPRSYRNSPFYRTYWPMDEHWVAK